MFLFNDKHIYIKLTIAGGVLILLLGGIFIAQIISQSHLDRIDHPELFVKRMRKRVKEIESGVASELKELIKHPTAGHLDHFAHSLNELKNYLEPQSQLIGSLSEAYHYLDESRGTMKTLAQATESANLREYYEVDIRYIERQEAELAQCEQKIAVLNHRITDILVEIPNWKEYLRSTREVRNDKDAAEHMSNLLRRELRVFSPPPSRSIPRRYPHLRQGVLDGLLGPFVVVPNAMQLTWRTLLANPLRFVQLLPPSRKVRMRQYVPTYMVCSFLMCSLLFHLARITNKHWMTNIGLLYVVFMFICLIRCILFASNVM